MNYIQLKDVSKFWGTTKAVENLNIEILDFLKKINNFEISRIIYTDINRDGTKVGPNLEVTNKIAKVSNCR